MQPLLLAEMEATCGERVYLRAVVLHYGGLLGWPAGDVIRFTEALTQRPWRDCGRTEFLAVLDEYLAILDVLRVKTGRHTAREEGGRDAPGD